MFKNSYCNYSELKTNSITNAITQSKMFICKSHEIIHVIFIKIILPTYIVDEKLAFLPIVQSTNTVAILK